MPPKKKSDESGALSNASLSDLFSRLTLAASTNDFEQALEISNQLLKASPNDSRAAKQKIIALIKLDKYKDALAFLEECTFLNKKETILEKGFCLYKLGKGNEAQKVLEEGTGRAIQHVRAQNVYSLIRNFLTKGISNGGFCDLNEIIF
jgi:tetratricopeptide (TPR) repeat protein